MIDSGEESVMVTYYLQRWKVYPLPERGLMRCHLQGVGRGWWGQWRKHEEFVNIPLREYEPVQETVRRAVFASSHVWRVSLSRNLSAFDGKFYQPVLEQAHEMGDTLQELDANAVQGRTSG
jgi:hypothetical protein